ncbi:hypothetical protein Q427_31715 [Halomonas sp. BC04]|nr:hypothetical protein Q427_31715 [Halomonas sp. BC04]
MRQGNGKRQPRSRGNDRRGQIPDLVSIHMSPPEIEDRLMPGHWEGDLMMGANNRSVIGTLVERSTRLVILAKLDGTTATAAAIGFSDKLNEVPRALRLSMTYDQGREMMKHAEITLRTGTAIYFADPHSPWQRGSNENTNGLLRQYWPKGTDLPVYSQEELDAIADSLNIRPCKTLDWRRASLWRGSQEVRRWTGHPSIVLRLELETAYSDPAQRANSTPNGEERIKNRYHDTACYIPLTIFFKDSFSRKSESTFTSLPLSPIIKMYDFSLSPEYTTE